MLSFSFWEPQPRSDVALVLNRGFGGSNAASLLRAAASEAVDRNELLPFSACSPSLP